MVLLFDRLCMNALCHFVLIFLNLSKISIFSVLERGPSQMSYLGTFLKESGGAVESDEADIEDNRAPSIASSKSNLSDLSIVNNQNIVLSLFGLIGLILLLVDLNTYKSKYRAAHLDRPRASSLSCVKFGEPENCPERET